METDLLFPISKRIAEIRRANNKTQEYVASLLDVSPKHISHVECATSSFSLKHLITFCNHFHCSLDYIVFGTKENIALSRLPEEIIELLHAGNAKEIERLNRYLEIYIELTKQQDWFRFTRNNPAVLFIYIIYFSYIIQLILLFFFRKFYYFNFY